MIKHLQNIQTILIILLFGVIFMMDNKYVSKSEMRYEDSVYYTHKDFIYYKPIIDSLENELFIKQIDIGRYESAIDYLDPKCKKQFESNCRE
jgi:hypothetical protein